MDKPNFSEGLIPAVVQDAETRKVLMLGYMNEESYQKTIDSGQVTFYSRSRKELWTKGETSGNFLELVSMSADCDRDTLLVQARPTGPVCHTGADTCWKEENRREELLFLQQLEQVIENRRDADAEKSYTARLLQKGPKKAAQKVGEEAAELLLEAMDDQDELFLEEAADLVYHLLVLLHAKGYALKNVVEVLVKRHG
jgi:phosphoribosyl-AMP cyclohydrolase / phosphoribosyl-ATP pyrophosphohydrolase